MAAFESYALIFTETGRDPHGYAIVTRVDHVRAVWDALDYDLRRILVGNTNKIAAIKYLRALTGLGLTEAKRAIECFTT